MSTYRNSFHKSGQPEYGPAEYEASNNAEDYRGHTIYRRNAVVWDIVLDGVCIGMYAGPNGARKAVDQRLAGEEHWNLV